MATETGPDLTGARRQLEALMDDSCRITRPLVDPQDPPVVYDATTHPDHASGEFGGARCLVGQRSGAGLRAEDDEYRYSPYATLPWDVTDVQEGDVLEVLTSRRDPSLPGLEAIVRSVARKTFLVGRRLELDRDEPARRHEEVSW